jgi:hypothetical protein
MNVEVKFVDAPNAAAGGEKKRRALVATRDFAAGEVIYQVIILVDYCSIPFAHFHAGATRRGRA